MYRFGIMARPPRIDFPDALYHVTSRGNGRQQIFWSNDDRQRFLDQLADGELVPLAYLIPVVIAATRWGFWPAFAAAVARQREIAGNFELRGGGMTKRECSDHNKNDCHCKAISDLSPCPGMRCD